jgi:hypothetical protein
VWRHSLLGEAVHKDVVALLRVGEKIEDLRRRRDVAVGALPAEVGVGPPDPSVGGVVAAQAEPRLEGADASGAQGRLVLGEV